jgi:hypothetical protein
MNRVLKVNRIPIKELLLVIILRIVSLSHEFLTAIMLTQHSHHVHL